MSQGLVQFEVAVVRETGKAILVDYEDTEFWIPRSQIKDSEYDTTPDGELIVTAIWIPVWLAEEKEMI